MTYLLGICIFDEDNQQREPGLGTQVLFALFQASVPWDCYFCLAGLNR